MKIIIAIVLLIIVALLVTPGFDKQQSEMVKASPSEQVAAKLIKQDNYKPKPSISNAVVKELADYFPVSTPSEQPSIAAGLIQPETVVAAVPEQLEHTRVFDDDELQFLKNTGAEVDKQKNDSNSGLVPYFGGSNSNSSSASSNVAKASASPSPSASVTEKLTKVYGQPRGYAMLYLMHPRAREAVEKQVATLEKANLSEIYLSVLTDGTFGKDFTYLADVVRRLDAASDRLILAIYFTNGASQRKYATTPITAGFVKIPPEEFRGLIKYDANTRESFKRMVREVIPVLSYNLSLSSANQNIAIPMLEDNLDRDAYKAMRDLVGGETGNLVTFVRNPCECYDGSDAYSFGDPVERHVIADIANLGNNDGYTLDGVGYRFDTESAALGLNPQDVKKLIKFGMEKGLHYFGLWRFPRQGIYNGINLDPDQRNYEVSNEDQSKVEVELLREGLTSE